MEAVLDSASDGILIETAERIVYANSAYARLLGYRRSADLLARPIEELIAAGDLDRLVRYGRMRAAGQQAPSSYEFTALRRDGTPLRLQASVSIAMLGSAPYIMTIVRPLTGAAAPSAGPLSAGPLSGPHDALSARERQVMERMLAGQRPKAIAAELGVEENTVATHRSRMFEKIGVADHRELFQYALRHKLVDWA